MTPLGIRGNDVNPDNHSRSFQVNVWSNWALNARNPDPLPPEAPSDSATLASSIPSGSTNRLRWSA